MRHRAVPEVMATSGSRGGRRRRDLRWRGGLGPSRSEERKQAEDLKPDARKARTSSKRGMQEVMLLGRAERLLLLAQEEKLLERVGEFPLLLLRR